MISEDGCVFSTGVCSFSSVTLRLSDLVWPSSLLRWVLFTCVVLSVSYLLTLSTLLKLESMWALVCVCFCVCLCVCVAVWLCLQSSLWWWRRRRGSSCRTAAAARPRWRRSCWRSPRNWGSWKRCRRRRCTGSISAWTRKSSTDPGQVVSKGKMYADFKKMLLCHNY